MNRIIIFSSILLFTACQTQRHFDFYGQWQSLNNEEVLLEITDSTMEMYRKEQAFWSLANDFNALKYEIIPLRSEWYAFKTMDSDNKVFSNGKIEVINENRIRVYYLKHHNILDIADEYHRTNGFNTFNYLMDSIMQTPLAKYEDDWIKK